MEGRSDDVIRRFVLIFGVLLVVFGGVILCYLGYLCFQVIHDPGKVRVVEYMLEQFKAGDLALYGNLEEKRYTIYLSEPLKTALFLFIGVIIVWVLARIVQSLISGGIKMISLSMERFKDRDGIPRSDSAPEMDS